MKFAPPLQPNLWQFAMLVCAMLFNLPCVCSAIETQTGVGANDSPSTTSATLGSVNNIVLDVERKTVKLYGAGGGGLDAYQSGFYVSAEGHIVTAWSTVLDIEEIIVVGSDGRRTSSTVVGIDPNLEIAVLKTTEPPTSHFDLNAVSDARVGQRVIAISNLYGIATGNELASVQKGIIMARTELNARRGAFDSVYQGPVLVIDAMTNNPGAAGGALTTVDGRLIGMLGKELRDVNTGIWLNYAIPIEALKDSIGRIIEGKAISRQSTGRRPADRPTRLQDLGIVLVPNVLPKTPAFIDLVQPNSAAASAGLQSDDLILFANSTRVASQATLLDELQFIDRAESVIFLVQRGRELLEITVSK